MANLAPLRWALAPTVLVLCLVLHQGATLPAPSALVLALAAGLLCLVIGLAAPLPVRGWAILIGLALLIGVVTAQRARLALADRLPPQLEGVPIWVEGVIDALPVALAAGQGLRFTFTRDRCTVHTVDARSEATESSVCALPARMALSWSVPAGEAVFLMPAQRWRFLVKLRRPHASVNFSAFDRELRLLEEGIGAIGSVTQGRPIEGWVWAPGPWIERLRTLARDALLRSAVGGDARAAGVLTALAVGDQAAVPGALWTTFNQTGVGHLMSISGLHVTLMGSLGGVLAQALWRSRPGVWLGAPLWMPAAQLRRWVTVACAFLYAGLAGWGIPAQRTCFMLALAMALLALGRLGSLVSVVGGAAIVVILIDPWAPLAAGFWLSFGAVMAIVWTHQGKRLDRAAWRRTLGAATRTQWAATVALLPLGGLFFGATSLIGPLVNAVAIPLVSLLVTPFAFAATGLALMSPALAAPVVVPATDALGTMIRALEDIAAWPAAAALLPRPGPAVLCLSLVAAMLLLAPWGIPGRWLGLFGLLPVLALTYPRPGSGQIWITALDVGQGTAVVVQTEGRTLLYDTGPALGLSADAGARTVVPWLQSVGVSRIDHLVISHQDDDHVGGAQSVIQALPPVAFSSSLPPGHPLVRHVTQATACRRGEGWQWGAARFEFLHPTDPADAPRRSPTNAVSCVLRIEHPGGTVLLTGDIEAPQERALLAQVGPDRLKADLLIVPHHGSRTSSTAAFIDAVSPRWALIQVAYRSRFGHPHPTVLSRYRERAISVLRSDAEGAIQVRLSADAAPVLIRARDQPPRYWRVLVDR